MQLNQLASTVKRQYPIEDAIISRTNQIEISQSVKSGAENTGQVESDTVAVDLRISEDRLTDTIRSMKEYTGWGNFSINFEVDKDTQEMVVKIVDRETGETIRQMPPDELLKLKLHMQEVLGLIFDHLA